MSFNNYKKRGEFTQILLDLMKTQKLSLPESLLAMSNELWGSETVKETARFLYEYLEKGFRFSMALRKCETIYFDDTFILFVSFSEQTGKIVETMEFLAGRSSRRIENINHIVEACIYPVFVIVMAVAGAFVLFFWCGKNTALLTELEPANNPDYLNIFVKAFSFLICFCTGFFYSVKKMLGEDKVYEAFLAADFLARSGVNLAESIGAGIQVAGIDSEYGRRLLDVKTQVENGKNLKEAFVFLGKKLRHKLGYVRTGGRECDVFGKVTAALYQESERRRRICISLIEPVFLLGTGTFLVILLWNIFGNGMLGWF